MLENSWINSVRVNWTWLYQKHIKLKSYSLHLWMVLVPKKEVKRTGSTESLTTIGGEDTLVVFQKHVELGTLGKCLFSQAFS